MVTANVKATTKMFRDIILKTSAHELHTNCTVCKELCVVLEVPHSLQVCICIHVYMKQNCI